MSPFCRKHHSKHRRMQESITVHDGQVDLLHCDEASKLSSCRKLPEESSTTRQSKAARQIARIATSCHSQRLRTARPAPS
eukprot:763135-Hanusia_phi.AAC.1